MSNLGQGRRILILDQVGGPSTAETMTLPPNTPLTINGLHGFKLVGVFGGATGNPRGAPYISGDVATNNGSGAVIQVLNTDAYQLEGFLVRNRVATAHGISIDKSARGFLHKVHVLGDPVNPGDGFRVVSGTAGQLVILQCGTAGCRNGIHLAFDVTGQPQAVTVQSGRFEGIHGGVCIRIEADVADRGLNALEFSGVSTSGPCPAYDITGGFGVLIHGQHYLEHTRDWDIENAAYAGGPSPTITFRTTTTHQLRAGEQVIVTAMTPGQYNYNGPITSSDPVDRTFVVPGPASNPGAVTQRGYATVEVPIVRIRAIGTDQTLEDNWAHDVTIEDNYFHEFARTGGWSTTEKTAQHVDANGCFNLSMRNNQHRGNLAGLTTNNPVIHLRANTRGCVGHINHVSGGDRSMKESVPAKIFLNEGAGNYGSWWDPATVGGRRYKKWGTWPTDPV
ncbi:MAG: hypothetical protein H0W27_03530 [Actinobacteria bacterium]|nr:hypothetical protein [Actinomycetota bacterium]